MSTGSTLSASEEKEFERQLQILSSDVVEITPHDEFCQQLKHSVKSGIPLRVKCGIDPTVSDIHLGHLIPYRKMRQFQDLGHIGVVIIGDYTACIGDPSGKNSTRPPLDRDAVARNAENYMEQVFTVLNKSKTEVRFQSEWFNQFTLFDILKWAGQTTVAKLLGHETFRNRLDKGEALSLHEIFYPVLQGLDSVFIEADVELGGTDQKFNCLMGRDYQKHKGLRPQAAMLLPIVTGLCGTQKMSKSLGNYIGVWDEPFDKFGKIMSIPDKLMLEYYQYLAFVSPEELKSIRENLESGSLHPNICKKDLAQKVVGFYHGPETGIKMRAQFEEVFAKGKVPEDVDTHSLKEGITLIELLVEAGVVESKSEVRRLLKQNAIGLMDGDKLTDPALVLDGSFKGKTLKVGKRKFLKML